jgi:CDP-glucose 4,6-dehydratase
MKWNNKNVLITGITGFLGPHIAKLLNKQGANIIGGVHDFKKSSFFSIEGIDKLVTIAEIDINNIDRLKEVITNYEIHYIFHCAAHSIVKNCINNPIGAFQANIIGTANILEAARLVGGVQGIMCMESDKSYGSFDKNELPYKEEHGIKPTNVYEVSKACSGLIATAYMHNYNIPIYTVRAANLYGPGDMNISRLIPGSILRLLNGNSPILYSGVADYIREFLYVEDAADAIIKLMENIEISKSQIFNIGSNSIFKISEVLDMIADKFPEGPNVKIVQKDILFKEIEEQYVDFTKLKKIAKEFSPRELQDGLTETINWYQKHYKKLTIPN